jgi:hypothetical protein
VAKQFKADLDPLVVFLAPIRSRRGGVVGRHRYALLIDVAPFHIRINMTELVTGKAVESVSHCGNDGKAQRLRTPIVKLRLWRMKGEIDGITSRK